MDKKEFLDSLNILEMTRDESAAFFKVHVKTQEKWMRLGIPDKVAKTVLRMVQMKIQSEKIIEEKIRSLECPITSEQWIKFSEWTSKIMEKG